MDSNGIVFGMAISIMNLHWERWGLAIYITPIVFGAVGVRVIIDTLSQSSTKCKQILKTSIIAFTTVTVICISSDVWLDMIVKALPDTRYISTEAVKSLEDMTVDNSYVEMWSPLAPDLTYKTYTDAARKENAKYIMVASYNYDAKFSSERFSPEAYSEDCEWYRTVFQNGELVYQISPWIKYKLMRDVTEYGDVEYTVPLIKVISNINHLSDYYTNPEEKYYGPLISI